MRRHRRIRRWLSVAAAVLFAPAIAAAGEGMESANSQAAESAAVWLPDPVETIDAPERRDEPPEGWRFRAHGGWGGATTATRRLWWSSGGHRGPEEVALASDQHRAHVDGGVVWRAGALRMAGGALAVPNFGLPGETALLVRRERGFGGGLPRGRATRAALGSGADLGGAALVWRDAVRVVFGQLRRAEGNLLALEVRRGGSVARYLLVRREGRTEARGGFAVAALNPAGRIALEAATGPNGLAAQFEAGARAGPMRGAARWRFEQRRERPGTLDIEMTWVATEAAARFRWRSWSQGALAEAGRSGTARDGADDGGAEVDFRAGRGGIGAWRLRLGSRPRQPDGSGGERYAIGDLVVAREPGRSLRLTVGDRLVQADKRWRRGHALGAALEIERRRGASLALTTEVVHAEHGAGSYGSSLDVAGGGSIRARTRTGLRAAARASIGVGAWRCGMAVDDEEVDGSEGTTAGEARAPRVNLWLAWSGGSDAR